MPPMKPIEVLIAQSERPVYVICPCPEWVHYHPDKFPAPLSDWMAQHCPDVAIARMTWPSCLPLNHFGDGKEHSKLSALMCRQIFLVGFNEEQAVHFAEAWKTPTLGSQEPPCNFYFITCTTREMNAPVRDYDLYAVATEDHSLVKLPDDDIVYDPFLSFR